MENQNVITKLFGTIPIVNDSHIDVILNTMTKEDALYIIIQSAKYSFHQGIFSLGESEVLSKAMRVVSQEPETKKEEPE